MSEENGEFSHAKGVDYSDIPSEKKTRKSARKVAGRVAGKIARTTLKTFKSASGRSRRPVAGTAGGGVSFTQGGPSIVHMEQAQFGPDSVCKCGHPAREHFIDERNEPAHCTHWACECGRFRYDGNREWGDFIRDTFKQRRERGDLMRGKVENL